MFIVRGINQQFVSEDFDSLQHYAYTKMSPKKTDCDGGSVFDLIAYIPGGYVKCEAVFFRGSNALAMPAEFHEKMWPKYADPIMQMHEMKRGLIK